MATAGKSGKKGRKAEPKPSTPAHPEPLVEAMHENGREPAVPPEDPRPTIRELAVEYLEHPDEWLDHPNPRFGGRTPNELIAAGEEDKVYNMFRRFELGLF